MARRQHPPPSPLERAWPWIVRFFGIGLILFETLGENVDRPYLLAVAGGMVGLPELVKWDQRRAGRR